jgi:acetate kinase
MALRSEGLVLALNCGSSSVKLALVDPITGGRSVEGLAERVSTATVGVRLTRDGAVAELAAPEDTSHRGAVAALVGALTDAELASVSAVGHRVVHGGERFTSSVRIDDDVLDGLAEVTELAPLHLPGNIAGIRAARQALPGVPDVAVFDTAFHRTLPEHAFRYAVPDEWYADHGVRRYGFHGISHSIVSARAAELLGRPLDDTSLVTLHLGNGCSGCAVLGGRSVDTTMGLTPLEGLVMGTRSGDLDLGVLGHVGRRTGAGLDSLLSDVTNRGGLLGLSGLTHDVRELRAAASTGSIDAQTALDVFAYRAAKAVGSLATALPRLDAVVLTGGIGERDAATRSAIMGHLRFLGVIEDEAANAAHGVGTRGRIDDAGEVAVLVVPTDEELVIARDTAALTGQDTSRGVPQTFA